MRWNEQKKKVLASAPRVLIPLFSNRNTHTHTRGDSYKWAYVCEHNCFIFVKSCNTTLASSFEVKKEEQNKNKSHNNPPLFLWILFSWEAINLQYSLLVRVT